MSASALTRRYAKALVELAVEQQAVDRYGEELAMINAVLDREGLLRQLLESPTLVMEKKSAMLGDLAAARRDELLKRRGFEVKDYKE